MSYLNSPRLTFSGQFQADPSTVNNDPTHFNNATFDQSFQDYSSATDPNGWWNPDGTGNWRFIGCKITSVTYQDGTSTNDPLLDPVIGMSLMDTEARTAGKIVDLDSQQQSVSELWGLIVRIVGLDGTNIMKGDYEVAPFTNLWFSRSVDQVADGAAAALYQSVIKNITWNDGFSNSRYLNELKSVSPDQLSIQFTVDRYDGDNTSPQFTLGRIAGAIGPYLADEPKHFVLGRQLFPNPMPGTPNYQPPFLYYATALVDEQLKQVVLDFSNTPQFTTGGAVQENRDLQLAIATSSGFTILGKINYAAPDWYMSTSGICTFPLTDEQLTSALQNPLAVVSAVTTPNDVFTLQNTTTYNPVMQESALYVRADKFVFRLDPEDKCEVDFYVTNLGKLYSQDIILQDATQAMLNTPPTPTWPNIGTPPISSFANGGTVTLSCYDTGRAKYSFIAADPGNPRVYIDGQLYGLSYNLSSQNYTTQCNQSNFISILIFSGEPTLPTAPDWDNFIQPIMQQYANLYPLMSKGIFNLADKNVVDNNAEILKLVFSKDVHDANYMPATRDLSAYKKKVILAYLQKVIDQK
jgi:hypothetical protein